MRLPAIRLVVLFGLFTGPVTAYFARAAAENMSYWYMYVLEGQIGRDATTRTVAPGCAAWAASLPAETLLLQPGDSSKCSLKGFLKYIWAPQLGPLDRNGNIIYKHKNTKYTNPDGTARTLDDILANSRFEGNLRPMFTNAGVNWLSLNLNQIYNGIMESQYYDGADPDRLLPSSAGDFWEARSRVTAALPAIDALYPVDSTQPKDYQDTRNLIARAKQSNKIAYLARLMDFEENRIGEGRLQQRLAARLGVDAVIKTKTLDTTLKNLGPLFSALDDAATRAANIGIEGFDDALTEVCQGYREDDPNHWTALQSARRALEAANCEIPGGAVLK